MELLSRFVKMICVVKLQQQSTRVVMRAVPSEALKQYWLAGHLNENVQLGMLMGRKGFSQY